MSTSKILTAKGGVTIPKDMRISLGWSAGTSLDITMIADGSLVLRPHVNRCRFCGSTADVRKFRDVCVCAECAVSMKEVI